MGSSSGKYRMILVAIGLAVFYWVAASYLQSVVFHSGSFSNSLFTGGPGWLWMRFAVVCILLAFGSYAQRVLNRQKYAEDASVRYSRFRKTFERGITETTGALRTPHGSEEQYHLLADNVADVIWIMDMNQRFSYISPSIVQLQGFTVEEVTTTMAMRDLLTPKSYEIASEALAEELAKEKTPGEDPLRTRVLKLEMHHKSGTTIPAELKVRFLRNKDGGIAGVVGVTRDISKHRHADKAIKLAYKTLDNVFQTATDGMRIIDKDFNVLRVSDTLASLSGWDKVEAVERKCHESFSSSMCGTPDCPLARILSGEERVECSVEKNGKDGKAIPCVMTATPFRDHEGRVIGIVENFKDMSRLKHAEDRLQKQAQVLAERVKELNCLYGVYKLVEKSDATLEKVLQGAVDLMPQSWHYPDITCARLLFDNKEFKTGNFKETAWKQSAEISVSRERRGVVEIYYLVEKPEADEGPFLKEERSLINSVAGIIGDFIERRQTEEALRRSEIKDRAILEAMPDLLFRINTDGLFLEAMPAKGVDMALSPTEFLDKNISDVMPKELARKVMTNLEQALETENVQILEYQLPIPFPDGSLHEFEARLVANGDDEVLAIIRDITERKRVEGALRIKDTAIESSINAIAMADLQGNLTYINRSFLEMWGYDDQDETLGKPALDFWEKPEDAAQVLEVLRDKRKWAGELTGRKKDGSLFNVHLSATAVTDRDGQPLCMMASFMDVTERKLAEETVRRRLEIEKTYSRISSRFVGDFDIDEAIDASLGDLGKLSGASRAYVFMPNGDKSAVSNTHEWCAEGVSPQIDSLQNIPVNAIPWWIKKLRAGEIIHVDDVSKLPPDASAEKDILEKQNIKSVLVLPLHTGVKLSGFTGLDNVERTDAWGKEDVSFLSVFANVLSRALKLKEADGELMWHAAELKAANSKLQLVMEEIRALSLTDDLTKLHNRRGFFSLAQQQLKIANRKKEGTFLLFVDLDNLKKINDNMGHTQGDYALKKIADILRRTFRNSDIIARVGGDEFAVMAVASSKDGADTLAARLHDNLKAENDSRKNPFELSASMGAALYDPDNPLSIDELLALADKEMYKQKRAKKKS